MQNEGAGTPPHHDRPPPPEQTILLLLRSCSRGRSHPGAVPGLSGGGGPPLPDPVRDPVCERVSLATDAAFSLTSLSSWALVGRDDERRDPEPCAETERRWHTGHRAHPSREPPPCREDVVKLEIEQDSE